MPEHIYDVADGDQPPVPGDILRPGQPNRRAVSGACKWLRDHYADQAAPAVVAQPNSWIVR